MKGSRPLTLLDVTCIGVNAVVGSSIFLFPGRLAEYLGPASILSFGLVGLLLIHVGLCFAEASTYFTRTGGPYLYAKEAFGDWTGFGIGWMAWITQVFSWAAVANAIAVYLGALGPSLSGPWIVKGTAATVVLSMGTLNYRGVKLGAWTSNFFTAAKLLPLLLFVFMGLPHVSAANYSPFAPQGWAPMGSACFLAYFAFQGFEYIPVPSGEVDRPARNIPLALILALTLSAALYMAIQAVAVGVHPGLTQSQRPLAEAALRVLGPWGMGLMVLGAVFSTTGYNASSALVTPRYLVAMAEDRHLSPRLAALHPRFQTPHLAVVCTTALTLVLAMFLDFNKLVDFSNVVVCAQYTATCASIPWLRRRCTAPEGSFRLPGGFLIPSIGIAATLWLGAQGGMGQVWWSLGILAFGLGLKAIIGFRASKN
ncbi:MAG: amino acid permease [Elusimicrobia bacterium]|nr:amino acid permease [Elusimicrobiota bacterium]